MTVDFSSHPSFGIKKQRNFNDYVKERKIQPKHIKRTPLDKKHILKVYNEKRRQNAEERKSITETLIKNIKTFINNKA